MDKPGVVSILRLLANLFSYANVWSPMAVIARVRDLVMAYVNCSSLFWYDLITRVRPCLRNLCSFYEFIREYILKEPKCWIMVYVEVFQMKWFSTRIHLTSSEKDTFGFGLDCWRFRRSNKISRKRLKISGNNSPEVESLTKSIKYQSQHISLKWPRPTLNY